jgi:CheY-like chemotaxis protein
MVLDLMLDDMTGFELLDQIRDWGAPDWVPYVVSSVIAIVAILLWVLLSVLAFIWIERRVVG